MREGKIITVALTTEEAEIILRLLGEVDDSESEEAVDWVATALSLYEKIGEKFGHDGLDWDDVEAKYPIKAGKYEWGCIQAFNPEPEPEGEPEEGDSKEEVFITVTKAEAEAMKSVFGALAPSGWLGADMIYGIYDAIPEVGNWEDRVTTHPMRNPFIGSEVAL